MTRFTSGRLGVVLATLLGAVAAFGGGCNGAGGGSGGGDDAGPTSASDAAPGPGVADSDGDGLDDATELAGWDIQVDRSGLGVPLTEHVTSDPQVADTDGDGLDDSEEFQVSDPRKVDTDGDDLSDFDEKKLYFSIPTSVDSDGDARVATSSNPLLWDGNEALMWHTSPIIDDTDGDNRSDYQELILDSTNALVAQVPTVEVGLAGQLDMRLNVVYTDGTTQSASYGATQSFAQAQSTSRSDTTSDTVSIEASATVGAEATAGLPPSASVMASVTVTGGYTQENSATVERSTEQSAAQEYSRLLADERSASSSVATGQLSVGLNIRNPSAIAYTLTHLIVTLRQYDSNGATFKTLATLTPALDTFTIQAGGSREALQVAATSVDPSLVREFLRDPTRLYLSVNNFDMTNAEGINFAFLDEVTSARTGEVVIDFGDQRVEHYRVATNVRRDASGLPAGVTLAEVLGIVRLPFATAPWAQAPGQSAFPEKVGVHVLTSLDGVAADGKHFWAVISSNSGHVDPTKNFEDIVLNRGESIHLAYVRDDDQDGVYDREERLFGSSDANSDSDGDGLGDFDEVKTGWIAGADAQGVPGYPRRVTSDPTRADADGDGLSDPEEKAFGSDPFAADADGDGLSDAQERALGTNPLDADSDDNGIPDSLDKLGLEIYYDMSVQGGAFHDRAGVAQDATITQVGFGHGPVMDRFGNPQGAYQFAAGGFSNHGGPASYGFAQAEVGTALAGGDVTLAGWVNLVAPGTPGVPLYAALADLDDVNVIASSGAQTNNVGADNGTTGRDGGFTGWTFVTVVRRANVAKLYLNGALIGEGPSAPGGGCGRFFVGVVPLGCAASSPASFADAWSSLPLDDVRVYSRALSAKEVTLLFHERGF
jgi:hypothetical protein